MMTNVAIKNILSYYNNDNIGVKTRLYNLFMHGATSGTGKLVILAVDQGFEHGPVSSFASNPDSYDPDYHFHLAISGKMSAYAAPLGSLECSIDKFYGQIPIILKLNNSNSLGIQTQDYDQAFTSSIQDAIRLGATAVGITIYPGSNKTNAMLEESREIIQEAKSHGLPVIVWCYPRGGNMSKSAETSIDICAYAAYISIAIGAHITKIKLPSENIEKEDLKKLYYNYDIPVSNLSDRIKHVLKSSFNNKRVIIFSGGKTKSDRELLEEIKAIKKANAYGSIIGRNLFQREYNSAIRLLESIYQIYTTNL